MRKIKRCEILLCIAAACLSGPMLAETLLCPDPSSLVCKNGMWAGPLGWTGTFCASGTQAISLLQISTLTTSNTDKSVFKKGPFSGDYMPLFTLACEYKTTSHFSAIIDYQINTTKKANFKNSENWNYGTDYYMCTDTQNNACALTSA